MVFFYFQVLRGCRGGRIRRMVVVADFEEVEEGVYRLGVRRHLDMLLVHPGALPVIVALCNHRRSYPSQISSWLGESSLVWQRLPSSISGLPSC